MFHGCLQGRQDYATIFFEFLSENIYLHFCYVNQTLIIYLRTCVKVTKSEGIEGGLMKKFQK